MNMPARKLLSRSFFRSGAAALAMSFAAASYADICQFTPANGSWDVPSNWANCTGGNGATPGTPGPADRAEITGRTVTLGATNYDVGDVYLGASVIQGLGIGSSTLNIVAGGTIAWGSGSYTFQDLTVTFTSSTAIPAGNGPMSFVNAQAVVNPSPTTLLADSITITGASSTFTNKGIFNPGTSLTMTGGAQFINDAGGNFSPSSAITINGPFNNIGGFYLNASAPVTMATAASFTQSDPNAFISGNGNMTGSGQVLALTGGRVSGNMTLTFQNVHNSGAVFQPGGQGTIGTITINGDYTQQTISVSQFGMVDFDLAGSASLDRLLVSGTATLGGSIHRTALGSFAPPVGTVLDLLFAGTISGTFDQGSEGIVFDAPRRYVDLYSATKYSIRANETVWVVGDAGDAASGAPTLRAAIQQFNSENAGGCINGPYSIHFGLSEANIQPLTQIPSISGCAGLLIDGYTQSGASPNTSSNDWDASLPVNYDGSNCPGCTGLQVSSANVTIRGLNVANWANGVGITGGSNGAHIYGNYFYQNGFGVVHTAAPDVHIGLSGDPATRNIVVHSAGSGILSASQTGGLPLHIENNLIGRGAGLVPGPNVKGIDIQGSNGVLIAGNAIANNGKGISITSGTGIDYSGNNTLTDNGIGIDLGDDGVTANDSVSPPYDTDTGANQLLNYPVINSVANTGGGNATINFTLKSAAGQSFQVFACLNFGSTPQCDQLANSVTGGTDAGGVFTGSINVSGANQGMPLTLFTKALSGPKAGNMSELSASFTVPPPAPSFTLTGSGAFPDTLVGNTSSPQFITIANSPFTPLTINVISVTPSGTFFDSSNGPPPDATHYCGFGSDAAGTPLTGAPKIINAESSCTMAFVFKPASTGTFSATLQITSDATGSPHTLTLTGKGVSAPLPTMTVAFSPATVAINTNSTMTLTLSNPDSALANISSGNVTLPAGVIATISSNTCGTSGSVSGNTLIFSGGSIPALGNCTIDVFVQSSTASTYTVTIVPGNLTAGIGSNTNTSSAALTVTPPAATVITSPNSASGVQGNNFTYTITATNGAATYSATGLPPGTTLNATSGVVSGTLTASGTFNMMVSATNGGGTGTLTVVVTVSGAPAPVVTLTPPALAFGAQTVNTTSAPQIVTLTNSGTANLFISGVASSGDYAYTTTCPLFSAPLAPAANCTFSITFTPLTVSASIPGNITVTDNAAGSPHVIPLSGSGVPVAVASANLSSHTLNFGTQPINSSTSVQTVAVRNTGFATLTFSAITQTGSASFSRVSVSNFSPDCATGVAPGGTCYINVIFTPAVTGTASAQITLASNSSSSPDVISLTGTGSAAAVPSISVPATLPFGDQIINTSGGQNLVISNPGTAVLNVSSIVPSGTNAASFTGSGNCAAVAPGASCAVNVTFTPTSTGAKTAQITITSNAAGQPTVTVTLSGNGILAPRPIVELSATAVGYGNAIFGGATSGQAITLNNAGGAPLLIQLVYTVGDFTQISTCPTSLESGAKCVITAIFSPLGVGNKTGELVIVSNAQGSPHHIPLSGVGCRWFSQSQSRFFLTLCGG